MIPLCIAQPKSDMYILCFRSSHLLQASKDQIKEYRYVQAYLASSRHISHFLNTAFHNKKGDSKILGLKDLLIEGRVVPEGSITDLIAVRGYNRAVSFQKL